MSNTGKPRRRTTCDSTLLFSPGIHQGQPRRYSRGTTMLSEQGHSHSKGHVPGRVFLKRWQTEAGAEPGINPRRESAAHRYGHFKQECVIHVIDYTTEHVDTRSVGNEEFIKMLRDEQMQSGIKEEGPAGGATGVDCIGSEAETEASSESRPHKPKSVKWINVGGIDWGVLSALALRYNLQSLALEDILHEQGYNQSKADYYPKHLFLRILCHWLGRTEQPQRELESVEVSNYRPEYLDDPEASLVMSPKTSRTDGGALTPSSGISNPGDGKEAVAKEGNSDRRFYLPCWPWNRARSKESITKAEFEYETRLQQLRKISALKGDRVDVRHEPMFIFLTRDGTVISIRPSPDLEFTSPIEERLRAPDSILRASADPSILVESLLDLVVDRVLEVIQEYQNNIIELEQNILMSPNMNTVRHLHILSGDLIMHKRTLEPIRAMIDGLRRYDSDRWAALAEDMKRDEAFFDDSLKGKRGPGHFGKHRHVGYFSYRAKLLLADVSDHMEFALASIDMFSGISENLINYAFNMASYEMNVAMRRLTLATIIFLPLTLLTGYFGMNFDPFPAVNTHSDIFFWEVAIPLMIVLFPVFLYPELSEFAQHVKKRMEVWRVEGHQ